MPFSDLDRIDITYFLTAKVGENFVVTIKWLRVKMKKILTKCLTNDKMIKNIKRKVMLKCQWLKMLQI